MTEQIICGYSMLMEMLGLYLLTRISAHIPEQMKLATRKALVLLLVTCVCFYLERWTQSFEKLSLLRPLLTACVYSLYPLVLFFLMRVTMSEDLTRKKLLLMLLPELIVVPFYFTSQWTHLIFWFEPDKRYTAGPLRSLPYVVVFFYSICFLYQNYRYFKAFNRTDQMIAAYTVLAPLLGMVLLRVIVDDGDYGTLLTSAILLYYAFLYIHLAKIDPLTGLFNRKCCYEDIQAKAAEITAVVSVDMNDLKYYNDNMGHQAGDEALRTVAKVLRNSCGVGGTVYRVGGDEFTILYSDVGESWVRNAIIGMREALSQTPYVCAFGFAMVWRGGSIDEAMVAADQAMYADKAAIKVKQKLQRRRENS